MMTPLFAAGLKHSVWEFLRRFGAFAFYPLGLLDMSVLPAPGSFDVLLIVLTAAHKQLWWYYALMATGGSVFGAWPSFKLGRRRGEKEIEKHLGPKRSKKIFSAFRRWGFWSVFAGAIAPPPMPASALILSAGALGYPWRNFLISWTLGRLLRFGLVAWITEHYGRHLFLWLRHYYWPALWTLIGLGVMGGAIAVAYYLHRRRSRSVKDSRPTRHAA
jgi:membrane protein YqaA with SNARE-associated domain